MIDPLASPLLADLYEYSMLESYLAAGMTDTATFEFFVRKLPPGRNFLVAAGLEEVLSFLENFRFSAEELAWLKSRLSAKALAYLRELRFAGDVHAMPEGTIFFPDEPILRVKAPLPVAQLVESRIMNLLNFSSMIASKAARSVLAAPGRLLVDFGLRRAHGAEAGLFAARSCYLAGFAGSSTVLAGALWEIPVFGTMAHSFVEAHENEEDAFENFARTHLEAAILLIDTYDTERGARRAAAVGKKLQKDGIKIKGVRIDSGDLAEHAKKVRAILDENGLSDATIFASGNLDEYKILELLAKGAPIDGFGIGTALDTSADAPSLDCAYKLQEYAGIPRRKRSEGKATWPGKKQVFRSVDGGGCISGDLLSLADEEHPGQPLIGEVMKAGKRTHPPEKLADIRQRTSENLAALPESLRKIDSEARYPVEVSDKLRALALEVDRAMGF